MGKCRHLFSVITCIKSDDVTFVVTEITSLVITSEAVKSLIVTLQESLLTISLSETMPSIFPFLETTTKAPILLRAKTLTTSSKEVIAKTVKHLRLVKD